jgi:hypothetical protein
VGTSLPPLTHEIELAGDDLATRVVRVPLRIDHDAPFTALKAGLLEGLDVAQSIEEALLRLAADAHRPSGAGAGRALVWIAWEGPADWTGLSPKVLGAWLDLGAEVLEPACPREVRVISALILPAGATTSGRLATWLVERRAKGVPRGFDWVLLPEAGKLEAGDVRAVVEAALPDACSSKLAAKAADLVFAAGGGDVDATSALVARAQAASWAALVRELEGTAVPEDGEMDTPF